MLARCLFALALLLLTLPCLPDGVAAWPALVPAAEPPVLDGLNLIGINEQGAETGERARDEAIVVRVPAGPCLARPYEGDKTTTTPKAVDVPAFQIDQHEVTNTRVVKWLDQESFTWRQVQHERWMLPGPGDLMVVRIDREEPSGWPKDTWHGGGVSAYLTTFGQARARLAAEPGPRED